MKDYKGTKIKLGDTIYTNPLSYWDAEFGRVIADLGVAVKCRFGDNTVKEFTNSNDISVYNGMSKMKKDELN